VATRTAAIPEGSVVSATLTPPLPANSSKMPTTAPATHALTTGFAPTGFAPTGFAPTGLASPLADPRLLLAARRAMGYSSDPAMTYRMPAMSSGGRCSTPTRMAR
jgi:hypothetical protein